MKGAATSARWAPTDVVAWTEVRISRMMTFIRVGSVPFVYIPIFSWHRLTHPMVAVVTALAATVEAAWFWRQARRHHPRDMMLVQVDIAFCAALMLFGSRAAIPQERNTVTTELLPFSLASPACVGFTCELSAFAILAVLGLMLTWSYSVYPDVKLKLASDLFGFAFWYVITLLTARTLRSLSRATVQAEERAAESQRIAAEREKETAIARQRERTHREIHDYLLPIVDHVAKGEPTQEWMQHWATGGADRARRLILDPRADEARGFEAQMIEASQTFSLAGLAVHPVLSIHGDPPEEVADAVVAATYEALRNTFKHAETFDDVNFFVDAAADHVEVVVRDRGVGFDPDAAQPGGGLTGTFAALRNHGGTCTVWSQPGKGTKVTIRWPETGFEAE